MVGATAQARVNRTRDRRSTGSRHAERPERPASRSPADVLLALQRSHGNQFVQRLFLVRPPGRARAIQRAIGLEFECTNLPIREVTDATSGDATEAEKGDQITGGYQWKMVFEKTAEGTPVVEFVTQPAAEMELPFLRSTSEMAKTAQTIPTSPGKSFTHGGKTYLVEKEGPGPAEGAVQVTMGVPLANIPSLFTEVTQPGAPRGSLTKYQSLMKGDAEETMTPAGVKFSDLPPASRGFCLLVMDYIKKGYLPPSMRNQKPKNYDTLSAEEQAAWTSSGRVFVKGMFDLMVRTDFNAIFKSMPSAEQDAFAFTQKSGRKIMKRAWQEWFLKNSVDPAFRGGVEMKSDPLISHKIMGWEEAGAGPAKGQWLRDMPRKDLLTASGFMGIGALGKKADVVAGSNTKAPIIEWREPYGAPKPVDTWVSVAAEQWDQYAKIVQGAQVNRGG